MSNRSSGLFDAAKFQFRPPYLLFLGEEDIAQRAKTATGLYYWRPEFCLGQHRVAGEQTWKSLGLPLPEMSPEEAVAQGAHSLIICMNDAIEARWVPTLAKAATLGLDIVSGTYDILGEIPEIRAAAEKSGAQLIDLRVPRVKFPETALKWAEQNKQNFGKRRPGKRCLAIGTDICVGKMFSMLAMEREMHRRGLKATFRATGQIGVLISGSGIAHDAIAGDFMVGTVEALTPANDPDHWDLVEGQGSLFHPYFSPSTISLMYGAQPDALVICHDLGREKNTLLGWPTQPLAKLRDMTLELCRLANPEVRLVGISLNTSSLATDADAMRHMAQVEAQLGVPCIDPIRGSVGPLVDEMLK